MAGKCVFITDLDTEVGAELAGLYLQAQWRVFGTVSSASEEEEDRIASKLGKLKDSVGESLQTGLWNRHSPVSAKNMILQARSRLESVSTFIVMGNPVDLISSSLVQEVRVLDRAVDSWIKGSLFLIREILRVLPEQESSRLALICWNRGHPESLLEEAVRQAFLGVAQSLLQRSDELAVNAFESDSASAREFAGYVFRNLSDRADKLSGKLVRFGKGFLAGLAAAPKTS